MPISSFHNINGLHSIRGRLLPRSIGGNRCRGVALDDLIDGLAITILSVGEANGVPVDHCGDIVGDIGSERNGSCDFVLGRRGSGNVREEFHIGYSTNSYKHNGDFELFEHSEEDIKA